MLKADDTLPFEDKSKELIISNLWLHWVNDLPKLFKEVYLCVTFLLFDL